MDGRLEGELCLVSGAGDSLGTAQIKLMAEEGGGIVACTFKQENIIAEASA